MKTASIIIIQYLNPSQVLFLDQTSHSFCVKTCHFHHDNLHKAIMNRICRVWCNAKTKKRRDHYTAFRVGLGLQADAWAWPCKPHLWVPTTDHADPVNAANGVSGTVQLLRHRFLSQGDLNSSDSTNLINNLHYHGNLVGWLTFRCLTFRCLTFRSHS